MPMPIIGRDGIELDKRWSPHPETYLALAVDGFPNFFNLLGPNSGIGTGSLLAIMEAQVMYMARAIGKMQRERIRCHMEPKPEAVRAFDAYLEVRLSLLADLPWIVVCSWLMGARRGCRPTSRP